jgi:HK97 family phage portal protein
LYYIMALFDFFKSGKESAPIEQRSVTTGDVTISDWDTAFGYGGKVDKLSVVYGCVNLRASTIASLPFNLYRETDKGHVPAKDHPYYNLLTKNPNPWQTNYSLWHWLITQLDLHGNAYLQKIRRNDGLVAELVPLNPSQVQISIDEDTGKPRYTMLINGRTYIYENDNIIHVKGYSHNGIYGVSVIEHFRTLFDGYLELEQAGTQIAKNAARPSVIIKHPANLKDEEKEKTKASWQSGFSGKNSGKAAMLANTYTVEAMPGGLSAADSEFIKQKQFTAQRIATDLFRVPLHMLGLTTTPTYASVEQMSIEWVVYGLAPTIANIEQQIQKQLLDDSDEVYFDISVNGLLRGDIKTRMEYYKFAMEHGAMTPNQFHQLEGSGLYIDPKDGGDSYSRPLNFSTTNQAVSADK